MTLETHAAGAVPAASGPVPRAGSEQIHALIEQIGQSARASKAAGENPHAAIDLVRRSGLGALRIPVTEGGGGCSVREFFSTFIDLAAADADIAHILRAHFWFTEERLRGRNPEVRERWLNRIREGAIFGNAMSEIGGSEPVGSFVLHTQLVPAAAGYRLNGTKYYCTGSLYADWVWVLASTPQGQVIAVVVPATRNGVMLDDDWDGIGQRFTASGTVHFKDVVVHEHEVLGMPIEADDDDGGNTKRVPTEPYLVGQFVQLILTAVIVGILRNVRDDAAELVRTRKRTFTHASAPVAAHDPVLQEIVGRIAAIAFAAEAAVLAAAEAQDAALGSIVNGRADLDLTHRASLLAAQAKVMIDELAPRAATALFDVGGSSAVRQSADLDRHWRNIRTLSSHNPTVFKARAIGDYFVNAERLPMNGYF